MSADLVAAFAAWGALVFVAVFAVLVAVAVRERLRNRLMVRPTRNATGDPTLDAWCAAAKDKMEAEIIGRLDTVRGWTRTSLEEFRLGLNLTDDYQTETLDELDGSLAALERSAPSIVPSSVIEAARIVPKLLRQRGFRVTSLLEYGPPELDHRLGLIVQVSRCGSRRRTSGSRYCTFWESRPTPGTDPQQMPLTSRVAALLEPGIAWVVAEVTRGLLETRGRRWRRAGTQTPTLTPQAQNAVGLVFREVSDLCPTRDTGNRQRLLSMALQVFGGVAPSTGGFHSLAQFFAGETARELADLAEMPSAREQWLTKARSCYRAALAGLARDGDQTASNLDEWIGVKQALAGLLSRHPDVRAAAADWACGFGDRVLADPDHFLAQFPRPRFRYSCACMFTLTMAERPARASEIRQWARYALATALVADLLEADSPSLWAHAPRDGDLDGLGKDAVSALEDAITAELERLPVTDPSAAVSAVAERVSRRPRPREAGRTTLQPGGARA